MALSIALLLSCQIFDSGTVVKVINTLWRCLSVFRRPATADHRRYGNRPPLNY
ncbi:hypothetical protein ACFPVT_09955 [Corynebacterium choanae]|uniref:hypothetical protein n=1 Tax=Corynebacterium choanae TaxID=1862358 RepID=UPI0013DE653F|nr:hypothetical protein [Corynebacterium choanae]